MKLLTENRIHAVHGGDKKLNISLEEAIGVYVTTFIVSNVGMAFADVPITTSFPVSLFAGVPAIAGYYKAVANAE